MRNEHSISPTLGSVDRAAKPSSLSARVSGILANPGDVFDEVVAAPVDLGNWRVPTLLVCLAGIILLLFGTRAEPAAAVEQLARTQHLSAAQIQALSGYWPIVSALTICLGAVAGSLWSALVLWLSGRVLLNVRFSFLKTLEIVGLCSVIMVLGTVVTGLLIVISGDVNARPSLAFLSGSTGSSSVFTQALDALNLFHLWATIVMSIGLAKLSRVPFRDAAFWVFGYWVAIRIALIILR